MSDHEFRRGLLYTMQLNRHFELAVAAAVEDGIVPGMAHLSVGHEAVAAGAIAALEPRDYVSSTHRAHGHALAKGADPRRMMAEIYGKETGLDHGRGGSLHIVDAAHGVIGANGIVGAWNLLGVGAGLSSQLLGEGRVTAVFMGDGSTNIGFFHEAMNLASVWDLPVVFICENNGWAISTPQSRHTKVQRLTDRAAAYAMPAVAVDGDDVLAVYEAARNAVARARAGGGPTFIEAPVWRWRPHYEGDLDEYRTSEQKAAGEARDPIARFARHLTESGVMTAAEVAASDARAAAAVAEAVEFAAQSPDPDPAAVLRDIYVPEPGLGLPVEPEPATVSGTAAGGGAAATAGTATEPRYITMSGAIREALEQEMSRDSRVIVMGEDVRLGFFGVTSGLADVFGPERVRDTPISESVIIGGAVGAAMTGLRPVAEIMFEDFIAAGFDAVINQAAKLRYMSGGQFKAPLVIRTPGGAGMDFAAQHSQSLEATFMHFPGLVVVTPADAYDAKGLLISAIRSDNPVLFLEHKLLYFTDAVVPEEPYTIPFGAAAIKRQGTDLSVIAISAMVGRALEAAEQLAAEQGIEVEVIDPRTLIPLDRETILASVRKTGRLLVVEEGCLTGGVGAEIAAIVAEAAWDSLKGPVRRLAALDTPVPFANVLETTVIPDAERIRAAMLQALG